MIPKYIYLDHSFGLRTLPMRLLDNIKTADFHNVNGTTISDGIIAKTCFGKLSQDG